MRAPVTQVGMSLLGAVAGASSLLLLGDRVGRRTELLAAAACYGAGASLTGMAGDLQVGAPPHNCWPGLL